MGDHQDQGGQLGQNMGTWNHRHKGSILSHPPWQPSICDWCPKHKSASFLQIWIGNIFPFGFICRPDNKYSVFCAGLQLLVYWDIHGKSWCCPNLPPSFQYNSIPRPHNPNVFDQLLSWGSFVSNCPIPLLLHYQPQLHFFNYLRSNSRLTNPIGNTFTRSQCASHTIPCIVQSPCSTPSHWAFLSIKFHLPYSSVPPLNPPQFDQIQPKIAIPSSSTKPSFSSNKSWPHSKSSCDRISEKYFMTGSSSNYIHNCAFSR